MRLILQIVAIHEYILSTRMTVQVAVEHALALLSESANNFLCVQYDRVQVLLRVLPATIEVLTRQRTAVVAVDDSVRIQDGHDLEDEVLA